MTPEGRVKKNINRVLARFPNVFFFMPVQYGMGGAGVDYHCVVGKLEYVAPNPNTYVQVVPIAFFIEAKQPGAEPTPRQENFLRERREQQGCRTFVIDEDPTINKGGGIDKLVEWLEEIEKNNEYLRAFTR